MERGGGLGYLFLELDELFSHQDDFPIGLLRRLLRNFVRIIPSLLLYQRLAQSVVTCRHDLPKSACTKYFCYIASPFIPYIATHIYLNATLIPDRSPPSDFCLIQLLEYSEQANHLHSA